MFLSKRCHHLAEENITNCVVTQSFLPVGGPMSFYLSELQDVTNRDEHVNRNELFSARTRTIRSESFGTIMK